MEARETRPVSGFPIPSLQGAERLACTLLVLCTAWFLLACHKPEADSTEPKDSGGNVLRFDVFGPIGSLDPNAFQGSGQVMIWPFLYSYLFTCNEDFQLEPGLATAWDYDPHTFIWTIHLRSGARFHDIKPVTSRDVRYSLETQLMKLATSVYSQIDRFIDESDGTLGIVLKNDDPDFLRKIFSIEIVPQPGANADGLQEAPVGSGPFKFSYRIGDREVGLVANKDFYLGRPALDGVIFHFEADKEKSWARLLSGKTDLMLGMNVEDYEMIRGYEGRFHVSKTIEPYSTALVFNTADPLFAETRTRLALAKAIDKDQIIRVILKGMAVACVGTMGFHSPFRNPQLVPVPYNPRKSAELLEELGWSFEQDDRFLLKDGRSFEFTILYNQEMYLHEIVGQHLCLYLNDLGIKVHLKPVAFDELFQEYWNASAFQAIIVELPDIIDNLHTLRSTWCPIEGDEANFGRFHDRRVANLIGEAVQTRDIQGKKQILHEVDFLLSELQPAVFLYQRSSLNLLSKRFQMPYPFSSIFARFHLWRISLSTK